MSDDFPPIELPPESASADQYPYGMDTIAIPFTWSKPRRQGPDPMERVGQGYAESRRQLEQALKDVRLTGREIALSALETLREDFPSFRPHGAGTVAAADAGGGSPDHGSSNGVTVPDQAAAGAGTAAGAATTAEVDKPQDPTAPVPVVDDQGNPVLIPDGPYMGRQMLRPAGLDPHFLSNRGSRTKAATTPCFTLPTRMVATMRGRLGWCASSCSCASSGKAASGTRNA